jgi:hypothetical protein
MKCSTGNKGYVMLITMLVVGAIGVSIAVSLLLLGTGATRSSAVRIQSVKAKAYANACAEEALWQIRLSTSYTGTDGLTFSDGSCTYKVDGKNEYRDVFAQGLAGDATRSLQLTVVNINPYIEIGDWQEVP